jgi:sugar (pentulose or hexulose) kinase
MTRFLGVDIGTTSVKAAVFDERGRSLAVSRHDYTLETPEVDRVQLDARRYWTATIDVVRRCLTLLGNGGEPISSIAVSSQGETTIAVDDHGEPLYPALVWLDNRAASQAARLAKVLGDQAYERTGLPEITPTWTACKVFWLREEQPEVFTSAHKFLLAQNFIVYQLSGQFVTDGAVACTSLLYDIVHHTWWDAALQAIGLDPQRLPAIATPGSVAGHLTDQAAAQLGLPAGIPVVLAGMDQGAGAVGAASITPEVISETTGGALAIQATVSRPDLDPSGRIPVYVHCAPASYLFAPTCDTGGMAFKWLRDTFGSQEMLQAKQTGQDPYDLLCELAEPIAPGADGLVMLPHLTGAFSPEYNAHARGVFYGFTLYHQRAHFARAALEAIAFMLRRNLELLAEGGVRAGELRSSGGGARSRLWRQIKADVCALPVVRLKEEEAALMGDAVLSAVAVGAYPSLAAACKAMVMPGERLEPNPRNRNAYDQAYRHYCELSDGLDPLFRRHFATH